jgi:hypothetical protein
MVLYACFAVLIWLSVLMASTWLIIAAIMLSVTCICFSKLLFFYKMKYTTSGPDFDFNDLKAIGYFRGHENPNAKKSNPVVKGAAAATSTVKGSAAV